MHLDHRGWKREQGEGSGRLPATDVEIEMPLVGLSSWYHHQSKNPCSSRTLKPVGGWVFTSDLPARINGEPMDPRRLTASVLGLAGLTIGLWAWRHHSSDRALADLLDGARPLEGRLSGLDYLPYRRPDPRLESDRRIADAERKLFDSTGRLLPGRLSRLVLFEIFEDRCERAVAELEQGAAASPKDAKLYSDLAAAYLDLSERRDDPAPLLSALAAADRAAELDRQLPEASFNRALSLEKLFLWTEAGRAWEAFLAKDSTSRWAAEAHSHLHQLQQPTEAILWAKERRALETGSLPEEKALRSLVTRFRQGAREYAEEQLFATWGEAWTGGRRSLADRFLSEAASLGRALKETGGDPMALDAAEAIKRAMASPGADAVDMLAHAHLLFKHGLELYKLDRFVEARKDFSSAAKGFSLGQSPMLSWAVFYTSVCDYYANNYEDVLATLAKLRQTPGLDRHPVLLGRTIWMMGLTHFARTNLRDSLIYFKDSLHVLEGAGEAESLAGIRFLLAENYSYSGESRLAWAQRYAGLRLRGALLNPNRLTNLLYDSADAALASDQPKIALYFHNEQLIVASKWGLPSVIAEALLRRSRTKALMHDLVGAAADLADADAWATRIDEQSIQYRIKADIFLSGAELKKSSNPSGAVADLSKALDRFRHAGFDLDVTQMLLSRAHALIQQGNDAAAEKDLIDAVGEHRARIARALRGVSPGPVGFDAAQVYHAIIDFEARHRGDIARALDYAEEARARALIDTTILTGLAGQREATVRRIEAERLALGSAQIRAALPPSTRLIEYVASGEDLSGWAVDRGGISFHPLKIRLSELSGEILRFRNLIARDSKETEVAAEHLYREIAEPFLSGLPPGSTVVFVPDGPLQQVPFAALRIPGTSQYLVERFDLTSAPSASLYAACIRQHWPTNPGILVVGSSLPGPSKHLWLPSLPGAELEARHMASLYETSGMLLGRQATAEQLLARFGDYEIVHFAGHSILNQEFPLESRLVLASGSGVGRDEVAAYELYGRSFNRTRLVVLSSCNSAGGETQSFQGLIGFARAFIANKVPVVVGTLWNIDDRLSLEFFGEFHRHLRQEGDPVGSLCYAQRRLLKGSNPQSRVPRVWAAFQIIGGTGS